MRVATLHRGSPAVHVTCTLQHCNYGIDTHLVSHLWYSTLIISLYSRIPLVRINWNGETSGYAGNPDDWIFFENGLHWQAEVLLLQFTVCTCVQTFRPQLI